MRLRSLHALVAIAFSLVVAGCVSRRRRRPRPRDGPLAPGRDRLRDPRHRRVAYSGERRPTPRPVSRCALAAPGVDPHRARAGGSDLGKDVAPGAGDELVVVVTADRKPIVLLQPESDERLSALIAKSDEPLVRGRRRLDDAGRDPGRHRRVPSRSRRRHARRCAVVRGRDDRASAEALVRGWADLRRSRGSSRPSSRSQSGAISASTGSRPRSRPRRTASTSPSACARRKTTARATSRLVERVPADAVAAVLRRHPGRPRPDRRHGRRR